MAVRSRLPWVLALAGVVCAVLATGLRPEFASASARQDYPAFALVAGLLLVGLVADDEGLFAAAGHWLAGNTRSPIGLFGGATLMIGAITATLNLDTSVAFLTPVFVHAARSRGSACAESPLLYGCLLLSNAGSLLLPGANLTNLIVLGDQGLGGGRFVARMWLPALAALTVTAIVVAVVERGSLRGAGRDASRGPTPGRLLAPGPLLALGAVVAATVLVLVLSAPAIPVLAVGLAVAALHVGRGRVSPGGVGEVLGVPVLIGLFGIAVALGVLGRAWHGPSELLAHTGSIETAALAAAASVLVNNLPAASLLAAGALRHPFSLLVGLNVGPNLCVTGSLAWLLWLKAGRRAGASPSVGRASLTGLIAVPLSMAAALCCLVLTGLG